MKPKIFITKRVSRQVQEYLSQFCDYRMYDSDSPSPREILLNEVSEVEGILNHACKIDGELINKAPKLKVVSNMSVGYNNFDLEAMKKRNILGTNTPGVLNETVADLVIALMLTAARRITEMDKYVKEGKWNRLVGEDLFGVDVHHATLGIIGLGNIGRVIAERAKYGFKMNILYHNRKKNYPAETELEARYCELDELLTQSDFIIMMAPLTAETRNMIRKRELSLMKKTAILINASRGETVEEEALFQALENGTIRAAALDVYQQEPIDANHPLLKLPNIVTVPHIGSAVKQTRDSMAMLGAENLVKALTGDNPPNLVNELTSNQINSKLES